MPDELEKCKHKTCPFCGGTDLRAYADQTLPDEIWGGHIACGDCDAQGPWSGWFDTADEAKEDAWKRWDERFSQSCDA